jgi:hypothetical protein
MSYIDSVARLLATENLNIERVPAETASFNLEDRILRIPLWTDLTENTEQLMVVHEVGHAKYTPPENWKKNVETDSNFIYYMNVCEDARIEKMMKREYPGVKKNMLEGYHDLQKRDFFGLKNKSPAEINKLSLINKINLHTKLGTQFGIQFEQDEEIFATRAEKLETFDEAVQLAKDIYEHSKQKAEDMFKDISFTEGGAFRGDGKGVSAKDSVEHHRKMIEEYMKVSTEEAFREALTGRVDRSTKYVYKNLNLNYTRNPVIPFTTVIKETSYADAAVKATSFEIANFKQDSDRIVGYLIKEFELKKSAEVSRRAVISKTGQLDMRKIFAYKIKDDLFRRVTQLPEGKNHGMVFLIDWSGSMKSSLHKTILQVLNLTNFCRRMQIPFSVLAFSDRYRSQYGSIGSKAAPVKNRRRSDAKTLSTNENEFSLLELLSSEMTNLQYTTMLNRLYCTNSLTSGSYALGGTPLNHALLYMLEYLPVFRQKYRLEKVSFIPLTDGEGNLCDWNWDASYGNIRTIIRDLDTKKEYVMLGGSAGQASCMLRIIKEKCSVKVIGFHLTTSNGGIQAARVHYTGKEAYSYSSIEKDFQETGVHIMKGTAHDVMFLVDMGKLEISDGDVTKGIEDTDSAKSAAKQLTKNFSRALRSRILLDKFIETMA